MFIKISNYILFGGIILMLTTAMQCGTQGSTNSSSATVASGDETSLIEDGVDINGAGQPSLQSGPDGGYAKGFYIGIDNRTLTDEPDWLWVLRMTAGKSGETHRFSGTITADVTDGENNAIQGFKIVGQDVPEEAAKVVDNKNIEFDFEAMPGGIGGQGAWQIKWMNPASNCYHFDFKIDGEPATAEQVWVVRDENKPSQVPFKRCYQP